MELKLLKLAINNLMDEVNQLKTRLADAESEIELLKSTPVNNSSKERLNFEGDELMDIKEVQTKLGICYNSLSKLVKQGILKPIRINQRRIRFLRKSVYEYIQSQC